MNPFFDLFLHVQFILADLSGRLVHLWLGSGSHRNTSVSLSELVRLAKHLVSLPLIVIRLAYVRIEVTLIFA